MVREGLYTGFPKKACHDFSIVDAELNQEVFHTGDEKEALTEKKRLNKEGKKTRLYCLFAGRLYQAIQVYCNQRTRAGRREFRHVWRWRLVK